MRAEHIWDAERALHARERFTRARPTRGRIIHARFALSTPICAMFLYSKMRPRIVLRQAERRVSIERALSACDKRATVRPHSAR